MHRITAKIESFIKMDNKPENKMNTKLEKIVDLLHLFDSGKINNEELIVELYSEKNNLLLINECDDSQKNKIFKILSKIKPVQYINSTYDKCDEYDEYDLATTENMQLNKLYLILAQIPDLWTYDTINNSQNTQNLQINERFNMTIINYMCYEYCNIYHECIQELTKYPILWERGEIYNNFTALHFLINNHDSSAIPIIEQLANYPYLWNKYSIHHDTPLHILCTNVDMCNNNTLNLLTKHKSLWTIQNDKYMTPLHYLCTTQNKMKYIDVFMNLAEYEEPWKIQNKILQTPFHIICEWSLETIDKIAYDAFLCKMKKHHNLWIMQNLNKKTPADYLREKSNDEYEII